MTAAAFPSLCTLGMLKACPRHSKVCSEAMVLDFSSPLNLFLWLPSVAFVFLCRGPAIDSWRGSGHPGVPSVPARHALWRRPRAGSLAPGLSRHLWLYGALLTGVVNLSHPWPALST